MQITLNMFNLDQEEEDLQAKVTRPDYIYLVFIVSIAFLFMLGT